MKVEDNWRYLIQKRSTQNCQNSSTFMSCSSRHNPHRAPRSHPSSPSPRSDVRCVFFFIVNNRRVVINNTNFLQLLSSSMTPRAFYMVRLALIRSRSLFCLSISVIIIGLLRTVDAHGGRHDHDDHNNNPNLRGIADDLIINSKNTSTCKDGEPPFTVGQVTFKCLSDFHQSGKVCGTPAMSEEEQVKAAKDFQAWTTMKASLLDGSIGAAASVLAVDWSTVITIPTYFHVIHSGTSGKQFTYASNPAYIRNQIKALNIGYRG
jgi:hypothetical protein